MNNQLSKHRFSERLEVNQLLSVYDIVCHQETWLAKQQEEDLEAMRKGYNAVPNSPNDDSLCITADNEIEYLDHLIKLRNLLAECDSTCVTVVGDYKANVLKNYNFAVLLKEYCNQFRYKWTSCLKLPEETHTYISDAWVVTHSTL